MKQTTFSNLLLSALSASLGSLFLSFWFFDSELALFVHCCYRIVLLIDLLNAMNPFLIILCVMAGYLIGTLPTARFTTRLVARKDILEEGSGNAGAMNSYRVSGKWWAGGLVAAVDILKGYLAVQAGLAVMAAFQVSTFVAPAVAGFFCVFGHCYNVWQGGRGGRGLAPAAGVMLGINPVPLVVFCLMWATGYFVIRRNVHVGSVAGALGTPLLLFSAPELLLSTFMRVPCEKLSLHTVFLWMLCIQLLVRHAEPIRELLGGPNDHS
jgi:glycerol-3-phosphate acyltransferase PlsY